MDEGADVDDESDEVELLPLPPPSPEDDDEPVLDPDDLEADPPRLSVL